MNFSKASPAYFRVVRYLHQNGNINDYERIPRPVFSIAYIEKGGGEFVSLGKKFEAEEGDVVFIPYGSTYRSAWKGRPEAQFISCHFSPIVSGPFAEKVFEVQRVRGDEQVHEWMQWMLAHRNDTTQIFGMEARFFALLEWIEPQLAYQSLPMSDPRLQTAAEYIHANYQKNFSVEVLATHCHMSESHFFALFRKTYGVSPITYKNRIAIGHAQQLLEERPALSIEEISDLTGFSSSSYFRRVFRSITGTSPRAYRKNPTV